MDVCETCGGTWNQELLIKCVQCNACQHRYCLEKVAFEMTGEWSCSECKKKDNVNGNPRAIQGEETEFERPLHGLESPQQKSKVKLIPCEEAASLGKRRRPARSKSVARRTHSHVLPASPPNMKQASSVNCMPPSSQVHPASPPNVKQSSTVKCVSTSRSYSQVPALKRCAAGSRNMARIDDIYMREKVRSGSTIPVALPDSTDGTVKENIDQQVEDEPREKKLVSTDKGNVYSLIQDKPKEGSAVDSSALIVADIGCESGMKSLDRDIDLLIISSSVEYARRPPPEAKIWTGSFLVASEENFYLHKFEAFLPAKVLSKVRDIAEMMPNDLKLDILPHMTDRPKQFETSGPVYEDISLIFLSKEQDCCEQKHPHLMDFSNSFVMRTYLKDIKLLIYPSHVLPHDAQWIDGAYYLWGIFVKSKGKSNPARLRLTST